MIECISCCRPNWELIGTFLLALIAFLAFINQYKHNQKTLEYQACPRFTVHSSSDKLSYILKNLGGAAYDLKIKFQNVAGSNYTIVQEEIPDYIEEDAEVIFTISIKINDLPKERKPLGSKIVLNYKDFFDNNYFQFIDEKIVKEPVVNNLELVVTTRPKKIS